MKVILYIHGKGGSYLEAEKYKKNFEGFDIIGVDYNDDFPWVVQHQIKAEFNKLLVKYNQIYLLANSIGAYFAMHALQTYEIKKALFISPILDMERLILDMMKWANVSEKDLCEKGEISTSFGEELSWEYLCYVREKPIIWNIPTEILYVENDTLTSQQTVHHFITNHNANLTVMKNGEHFFHTDEQLAFLDSWIIKVMQSLPSR